MSEEEIAAQLRSVIQAAYEPVSATIAVITFMNYECSHLMRFVVCIVDTLWACCQPTGSERTQRRDLNRRWSHLRWIAWWLSTSRCCLERDIAHAPTNFGESSPGIFNFEWTREGTSCGFLGCRNNQLAPFRSSTWNQRFAFDCAERNDPGDSSECYSEGPVCMGNWCWVLPAISMVLAPETRGASTRSLCVQWWVGNGKLIW